MAHLLTFRSCVVCSRSTLKMASTSAKTQKLTGKVAVVTAATEGIGYAIAERLGNDGAKVMISSRKQDKVDAAIQKLKAQNIDVCGMVCHVGKKEDRQKMIDKTLEEFGGIDILISNAAANPYYGPLLQCSEEAWDKIFDINVKATFMLCKEIVPHMEKRGKGAVAVVTSIAAYRASKFSVIAPYAISKTALLGLTKGLSNELSPRNIRVNGIAPGVIKTRFSEALWKDEESVANKMILATTPMNRHGDPSECGSVVSFLVSDDASYITGETIVIAGGVDARL